MIANFFLWMGRIALDFLFGWLPSAGLTPSLIQNGLEQIMRFVAQFDFIVSFYDLLANFRAVLGILVIEYGIYLVASIYKRIPFIGK